MDRGNDVIHTERPIIAVLAQELTCTDNKVSYIAASYVKDIESAGGRVVPIPTNFDAGTIQEIFTCVNGLLIPGGGAKLLTSAYYKNAKLFYDLALQANQIGDFFPIWGTCLGFEALPLLVTNANTRDILTSSDALDIALPLEYTTDAANSRLFHDMSPSLYKAISCENVTYNFHKYGFKPEIFEDGNELDKFFKVLSTNIDKSGERFVSTIEARDYPFYGVMWHPEKVCYEFKTMKQQHIPHSLNAVRTTQYMSRFFVHEARKSKHTFSSTDMEEEYLIYRHTPVRPDDSFPNLKSSYELVYLFE